jgi:hypothetical protein
MWRLKPIAEDWARTIDRLAKFITALGIVHFAEMRPQLV